jgi:methionyl-tRNA formyltransferase
VARLAVREHLTILQPETLKDRAFRARMAGLSHEVGIVVAFGRFLPRSLLTAPCHGCLNVHFSLLPRHRGAAPVQRTILAGDPVTGVTTMQMDPGLDTGPVLLSVETPVGGEETAGELGDRLALMGAGLLLETLERLARGVLEPRFQDEEAASLAPSVRPEEAWVDWSRDAAMIARQVRAFQPWPVARTRRGERVLRLLGARALSSLPTPGAPGEVLGVREAAVIIACGGGSALAVTRLQPAGRRPMEGRAAVAGRYLSPGDRCASAPASVPAGHR